MLNTLVGRYRLTGRLGRGGMGVVYEADDTELNRVVALKFLPTEFASDEDAVRRFKREAQTVALLNHPHICTVYDIGEHDGRAYIAMERIDGVNLKTLMARKTLDTGEVVDIALQIARALGAAHEKGIVHRDIKPGNLVVSAAGQTKVLDFGLARRFKNEETGSLSLEGSTVLGRPLGTANYMAPERILQGPLDPRCDLFSLGVVMYEMSTGRLPFAGASPGETVSNVLEKNPVPLTTLSPERPGALERIVDKLLAKLVERRYQTAGEVEADLLKLKQQINVGPVARLFRRIIGP